MEKIMELVSKYWIILVVIGILIILFIIGYMVEYYIKNKDKKIIFDKENKLEDNLDKNIQENIKNNDQIIEAINNPDINSNVVEENNENIEEQIKENISYITNSNGLIFDEFEKIIPEKKLIDDELKEKFETFNVDIEPMHYYKEEDKIDTNIELPNIELEKDDEDIWK